MLHLNTIYQLKTFEIENDVNNISTEMTNLAKSKPIEINNMQTTKT